MFKKISKYFNLYWREIIFLFFLSGSNMVLRFYKLAQKGLCHTDEVDYYFVCKSIIVSFKNAVFSTHGIINRLDALYKTLQLLTQYPPKFAFYLINSIAYGFFENVSTILFVSAVSSIFTIVIVFIIGRKFFNLRTGIIASTLFSFSLIYLRYSRNGFSMALTYLFLVLSVYYYLDFLHTFRMKHLRFSGLVLGITFLIHPQIISFLPAIVFVEFISSVYFYKDKKEFLERSIVYTAYFFIPFLLLGGIIHIGRIFHWYTDPGYLQQIIHTVRGNFASWWLRVYGIKIYPAYYLKLLWYLESPFIFLLAALSLFLTGKQILWKNKKSQSILLISALFILPYLYWLFQRRMHQVEYNCLGAWPFMFLYIAIGCDTLFVKIQLKKIRIFTMVIFLMISISYSLYHLRSLYLIKSHFPEISEILRKNQIKKIITYKVGAIYRLKDIDPYLKNVTLYPANNIKEVYEIAEATGIKYCFYDSWEYFQAKNYDSVVDGEIVAKIKNTTIRPHYPLLFMIMISLGIDDTQEGKAFQGSLYDYIYVYKIKLP